MATLLAGLVEKKCVTIAEISDGNDLQLKEEALADILMDPELQDKPLMILSISGAFRKGKSFMLTFLMRYLQNEGHMYVNWLGLEAIINGFFWRGGLEPVTTGITMWKEPFFIEDDSHRKVAVLLMDTQGLFDHESKTNLHSRIFAFSTLISSVQVYNVSQQILGSDLEYLEFFLEYAKVVRDSCGTNQIPFQKLLFLVRDWTDPRTHDYGNDGARGEEGYLPGILRKEGSHRFGEKLNTSFESIGCFLMPHPGSKVAVSKKDYEFRGDLKDIKKEFQKYAKRLALFLFNPSNLVPKKINGEEVCARDLLNYTVACAKQFGKGPLPEIGSMIEVAAVTLCIRISESLVKKYDETMEEVDDYLPDHVLQEKHGILVENLQSEFRKQAQFGQDDLIKKHSDALMTTLEGRYAIFQRSNEAKKKKQEADMSRRIVRCLEEFRSIYSEAGTSDMSERAHQEREKILKEYSEEFPGHPSLAHYTEILQTRLDEEQKRQEQLKMDEKADESSETKECLEKLRSQAAKITGKYLDAGSLWSKCEAYKEDIIDKYCKEMPGNEVMLFRIRIGQAMDLEIKRILQTNSWKEDSVRLLFQNEIDELLTVYMKIMDEGMRGVFVAPNVMHEAHKKTKKMLEKKLRSNDKIKKDYAGDELWEEFTMKMNDSLDEEFEKRLEKNMIAQILFPRTQSRLSGFFASALIVILAVIGAPIAIAIGIPLFIFRGLKDGASNLVRAVKDKLQREGDK